MSWLYEDVPASLFLPGFWVPKGLSEKKASPALLTSQHFASLWAQRELGQTWLWALAPINCTQSWSWWHQKRDTSKHNCSWPGLPSGSSSLPTNDGESWEQPHLWLRCPRWKCQPEAIIQNHTDWDISALLVHRYPDLIHNGIGVTGRTDRAGKADLRHLRFPLVFGTNAYHWFK